MTVWCENIGSETRFIKKLSIPLLIKEEEALEYEDRFIFMD